MRDLGVFFVIVGCLVAAAFASVCPEGNPDAVCRLPQNRSGGVQMDRFQVYRPGEKSFFHCTQRGWMPYPDRIFVCECDGTWGQRESLCIQSTPGLFVETRQSSDAEDRGPSLAVDGEMSTCSKTKHEAANFWTARLQYGAEVIAFRAFIKHDDYSKSVFAYTAQVQTEDGLTSTLGALEAFTPEKDIWDLRFYLRESLKSSISHIGIFADFAVQVCEVEVYVKNADKFPDVSQRDIDEEYVIIGPALGGKQGRQNEDRETESSPTVENFPGFCESQQNDAKYPPPTSPLLRPGGGSYSPGQIASVSCKYDSLEYPSSNHVCLCDGSWGRKVSFCRAAIPGIFDTVSQSSTEDDGDPSLATDGDEQTCTRTREDPMNSWSATLLPNFNVRVVKATIDHSDSGNALSPDVVTTVSDGTSARAPCLTKGKNGSGQTVYLCYVREQRRDGYTSSVILYAPYRLKVCEVELIGQNVEFIAKLRPV